MEHRVWDRWEHIPNSSKWSVHKYPHDASSLALVLLNCSRDTVTDYSHILLRVSQGLRIQRPRWNDTTIEGILRLKLYLTFPQPFGRFTHISCKRDNCLVMNGGHFRSANDEHLLGHTAGFASNQRQMQREQKGISQCVQAIGFHKRSWHIEHSRSPRFAPALSFTLSDKDFSGLVAI